MPNAFICRIKTELNQVLPKWLLRTLQTLSELTICDNWKLKKFLCRTHIPPFQNISCFVCIWKSTAAATEWPLFEQGFDLTAPDQWIIRVFQRFQHLTAISSAQSKHHLHPTAAQEHSQEELQLPQEGPQLQAGDKDGLQWGPQPGHLDLFQQPWRDLHGGLGRHQQVPAQDPSWTQWGRRPCPGWGPRGRVMRRLWRQSIR